MPVKFCIGILTNTVEPSPSISIYVSWTLSEGSVKYTVVLSEAKDQR